MITENKVRLVRVNVIEPELSKPNAGLGGLEELKFCLNNGWTILACVFVPNRDGFGAYNEMVYTLFKSSIN